MERDSGIFGPIYFFGFNMDPVFLLATRIRFSRKEREYHPASFRTNHSLRKAVSCLVFGLVIACIAAAFGNCPKTPVVIFRMFERVRLITLFSCSLLIFQRVRNGQIAEEKEGFRWHRGRK